MKLDIMNLPLFITPNEKPVTFSNPSQYEPVETITTRDGKQVTFYSEVHGTIQHISGGARNWRYVDYELQVQASNGYWLSQYEKWTPYHEAVDWAVEQLRLRRYVAEVESDKVVELDVVRRNKETATSTVEAEESLNEYAISYYTEVEPEITEEWEMNQWGEYELVRAYIEEDLSYIPNTNPQSQYCFDEF